MVEMEQQGFTETIQIFGLRENMFGYPCTRPTSLPAFTVFNILSLPDIIKIKIDQQKYHYTLFFIVIYYMLWMICDIFLK